MSAISLFPFAWYLTGPFVVDFEQPRVLWQKVFSDTDREHYVSNVSGHIKGVKNKTILERQRKFLPCVPHGAETERASISSARVRCR